MIKQRTDTGEFTLHADSYEDMYRLMGHATRFRAWISKHILTAPIDATMFKSEIITRQQVGIPFDFHAYLYVDGSLKTFFVGEF